MLKEHLIFQNTKYFILKYGVSYFVRTFLISCPIGLKFLFNNHQLDILGLRGATNLVTIIICELEMLEFHFLA